MLKHLKPKYFIGGMARAKVIAGLDILSKSHPLPNAVEKRWKLGAYLLSAEPEGIQVPQCIYDVELFGHPLLIT